MRTIDILIEILDHNGVDAKTWTKKEIREWAKANFFCSNYVARKVAEKVYYNKEMYCI